MLDQQEVLDAAIQTGHRTSRLAERRRTSAQHRRVERISYRLRVAWIRKNSDATDRNSCRSRYSCSAIRVDVLLLAVRDRPCRFAMRPLTRDAVRPQMLIIVLGPAASGVPSRRSMTSGQPRRIRCPPAGRSSRSAGSAETGGQCGHRDRERSVEQTRQPQSQRQPTAIAAVPHRWNSIRKELPPCR